MDHTQFSDLENPDFRARLDAGDFNPPAPDVPQRHPTLSEERQRLIDRLLEKDALVVCNGQLLTPIFGLWAALNPEKITRLGRFAEIIEASRDASYSGPEYRDWRERTDNPKYYEELARHLAIAAHNPYRFGIPIAEVTDFDRRYEIPYVPIRGALGEDGNRFIYRFDIAGFDTAKPEYRLLDHGHTGFMTPDFDLLKASIDGQPNPRFVQPNPTGTPAERMAWFIKVHWGEQLLRRIAYSIRQPRKKIDGFYTRQSNVGKSALIAALSAAMGTGAVKSFTKSSEITNPGNSRFTPIAHALSCHYLVFVNEADKITYSAPGTLNWLTEDRLQTEMKYENEETLMRFAAPWFVGNDLPEFDISESGTRFEFALVRGGMEQITDASMFYRLQEPEAQRYLTAFLLTEACRTDPDAAALDDTTAGTIAAWRTQMADPEIEALHAVAEAWDGGIYPAADLRAAVGDYTGEKVSVKSKWQTKLKRAFPAAELEQVGRKNWPGGGTIAPDGKTVKVWLGIRPAGGEPEPPPDTPATPPEPGAATADFDRWQDSDPLMQALRAVAVKDPDARTLNADLLKAVAPRMGWSDKVLPPAGWRRKVRETFPGADLVLDKPAFWQGLALLPGEAEPEPDAPETGNEPETNGGQPPGGEPENAPENDNESGGTPETGEGPPEPDTDTGQPGLL